MDLQVVKSDPVVGTSDIAITFSEAVSEVTGQQTDGTCDETKTVKLTNYAGTCYGVFIVGVGNTYTINPVTDLVSGTYTLTLGSGIKDAAGNALSETSISFTVYDALTTAISSL
mgnify:CR=1 FL=1